MSNDFRQRLRNPRKYEQQQSGMYRLFSIGLSFGISMGVSLFLMIKLGAWLDTRFDIDPYGSVICVMTAVAAGFRSLYREVLRLEEDEDSQRMGDDESGRD